MKHFVADSAAIPRPAERPLTPPSPRTRGEGDARRCSPHFRGIWSGARKLPARTRPMNDVTKSNAPVSYAEKAWQSDVIVDLIKHYDFPYIALNPGASYRGLHDSLVN